MRQSTPEEIAIISDGWPKGGYAEVKDRLPGRNYWQIRSAARRFRLFVAGRTYMKQPTSEWIDAAIGRAYRTGKVNLHLLSKQLGRTKGWIKWRAREMGVARMRGTTANVTWLPEEIELLKQLSESGIPPGSICKRLRDAGFYRSVSAISNMQWKLQLPPPERSWWTAKETAIALNIDEKTVTGWIEKGLLKAKKRHGPKMEGNTTAPPHLWEITANNLRRFLIHYPRHWDHRRVPIEMLIELLCGVERQIGEFITNDVA